MTTNEWVYLDVKFNDKDKAKELGARWDGEKKLWYCHESNKADFKKWFFKGAIPEKDLRVVDQSKWKYAPIQSPKLYIDMIPESSFCDNLRSGLDIKDWDLIRKAVYRFGKYKCEICSGVGEKHPVEAHERWEFDSENLIQKLVGVSCLCPKCHQATHMGFARIQGKEQEAGEHLQVVNKWTEEEVNEHMVLADDTWQFRSKLSWKLDISWLKDCEIPLSEISLANIINNGEFWTFSQVNITTDKKVEDTNPIDGFDEIFG